MILLDPHQDRRESAGGYRCAPLRPTERSLADQFYRLHGSRMQTRSLHTVWAISRPQLVACLCLQPIEQGHWLTSLFVDPSLRQQGLASRLLHQACASLAGPVWLFCQPELQELYGKQGFVRCSILPESLAAKLQRYQRRKDLVAMWRPD